MGKRREGREAAVQMLYQFDLQGESHLEDPEAFWLLRENPQQEKIPAKTRIFAEQLVEGVNTHR